MAPPHPTDTSHEKERKEINTPSLSPDVVTYSPNFNSVREELKHDPNRYSPLSKNSWKLVLDLSREILYILGEYPEDPALGAACNMLKACRERQRVAAGLTNPADAIVKEHALNVRGICECMLCVDHAQLARSMELYLAFEEKLILKAIHRIQDPRSRFPDLPPVTPTHLKPYPHYIEETISGDIPALRRAWKK